MKIFKSFIGEHEDFVHDVCFDFYGQRLATCSSDHKIKVWSQTGEGEWVLDSEVGGKTRHLGPVWKVAWAHPEFGSILASCSFDQTIRIWEEWSGGPNDMVATIADNSAATSTAGTAGVGEAQAGKNAASTNDAWKLLSQIRVKDQRQTFNDIKFAPRHDGIQLAACTSDGYVYIWQPDFRSVRMTNWDIKREVNVRMPNLTSLSWCESPYDIPMFVVASASGKVRVMGWDVDALQYKRVAELDAESADNQTGVSGGSGGDGVVVEAGNAHAASVNEVCWAPNLGRSYHTIATVSSDKHIKIWKLSSPAPDSSNKGVGVMDVVLVADLADTSEVWRAEWNVTGTALATSADDGKVKLWRQNLRGQWECVTNVTADSAETPESQ